MPRQWPPPSRPRISAETSWGASSSMGRCLLVALCRTILDLAAGFLHAGLVLGVLVVEQDAVGRAVHVVVLAAVHPPEQQPDGQGNYDQGDRDHDIERGH